MTVEPIVFAAAAAAFTAMAWLLRHTRHELNQLREQQEAARRAVVRDNAIEAARVEAWQPEQWATRNATYAAIKPEEYPT